MNDEKCRRRGFDYFEENRVFSSPPQQEVLQHIRKKMRFCLLKKWNYIRAHENNQQQCHCIKIS